MQEDFLESISFKKIYTVKTIVVSSFFGGLLASGFMLYKNFKAFGDFRSASLTVIFTILLFLALMATSFIPALEKIPNLVYSFLITVSTSFFTKKYQEALITEHVKNEGKLFSNWNAFLVCIISILIIVLPLFIFFLLQDAIPQ